MTPPLQQLALLLSDGRFHSGQHMSELLNVSRGTVWNLVQRLTRMGMMIDRVRGRGYRSASAVEFFQSARIDESFDGMKLPFEIVFETDSTNRYLMSLAQAQPSNKLQACLAEYQTAGRGRRGRNWVSPLGCNIYLSLLRRFDTRPAALEGVSLVSALAVLRALRDAGVTEAGVKWPNDIYARGKKLAGILLEMGGEPSGECYIVAGVGINLNMPTQSAQSIDQQWTDIAELAAAQPVSRNFLAGRILERMVEAYDQFERQGLDAFLPEWYLHDLTFQRAVSLNTGDATILGKAVGIDAHGALLLEHDGRVQRYFSGDVSLRLAQGEPV